MRTSVKLAAALGVMLVSAPAFAQTGGPDLPGGAKTTNGAGMSTSMPRKNMNKMKMVHKGKMKHHKSM